MKLKTRLLLSSAAVAAMARPLAAQVSFSIDPTKGQAAISPFIYGVNGSVASGTDSQGYSNLNLTWGREGGDRFTAYNYTNNASNAGSDYYYSNDNYLGGGSTPGGAVLPFLQTEQSDGAGAMVTVPINGYVAANFVGPVNPAIPPQDSPNFVPEYPTEAQDPDPAPNHVYQNGFVQIVQNNFQQSASQPLAFELDNEPELWNSTHPEVHPGQVTYAELMQKSIAYATMIKQVDPNSMVFGWASYGWAGYETLDNAPDSAANGNFMNYYLSNFAAASAAAGTRLLDAVDLHYYPASEALNSQGQETDITADDTSPAVVAARLQAPRSLWDPTYSEPSAVAQEYGPLDMLPRTQAQINTYYPGTKMSISEYNFGAGYDISGGIAEADVLGIFGKYGLYSANEIDISNINDNFTDGAFQIYRNYDGKDSTFGDTEVQANNSDTVDTSVYASVDADDPNHLTVVAINKEDNSVTATLSLADSVAYKTIGVYQLTSASSTPQFVGDVSVNGASSFTYAMPAYSVSMLNFYVPGETVGTWDISGSGKWATLGDWSGAPPQTAGDTANFTSAITSSATVRLGGNWSVGTINFANTHSYTIGPGSGGTLTLDNGANSAAINVTQGSHFITAPVVLNSNTVATIGAGDALKISGAISGNGGLTVAGSGSVVLTGTNSYTGATTVSGNLSITKAASLPAATALSIQNGGDVALPANIGQVTLQSISATGTGKLDLANNHLIINYGSGADPIASIAALLKSGYAGGEWNGPGIDSSSAASDPGYGLGYADGSDGDVSGLSSGQIEIKFTLLGDANLDGEVNGADFTLMAANFNLSGRVWDQGDFNYDGDVNGSDFVLLADNFNQFASQSDVDQADLNALDSFAAANGISLANIPEPTVLEIMLFASFAVFPRRRRVRMSIP